MKLVRTTAFIPFPPAAVWAVLADFSGYSAWNPLNLRAEGRAEPGARVQMLFVNPLKRGATVEQTVTIIEAIPGRRLAWRGRVALLFSGEHAFDLSPENGGTRLVHSERLGGLLIWLTSAERISRTFTPLYEAANQALGKRVATLARRQVSMPDSAAR